MKQTVSKLIRVSIDEVKPTRQSRQTVLEAMIADMTTWSNYRLVTLWNSIRKDSRNRQIIPLAEVLKSRELLKNVRSRSEIKRKFIPDEDLARLRRTGTVLAKIKPVKAVPEKITPKIPVKIVCGRAGRLARSIMRQTNWTVTDVDPLIVRRTPGLKQTLQMGHKGTVKQRTADRRKRRAAYEQHFMQAAKRWAGVQVVNCKAGPTFKALLKIRNVLVDLRAGVRRGEEYIQARPVSWSDLTEVR
jgi:hypothetical protein